MSQYEFAWPFPAGEVFVTGTFDNWSGSVKLNKNSDGTFSAVVDLGPEVEKVLYKYIVDGNWTVNNAAHKENDFKGIENNVLYKHEMKTPVPTIVEEAPKKAEVTPEPVAQPTAPVRETTEAQSEPVTTLPIEESVAEDSGAQENIFTSSAAPDSTTAELAAQVPLVRDEQKSDVESTEAQDVAPEEAVVEQIFSISPFPATTTAGNPIQLEPGEPVPKFIAQNVTDTVNLDEESYEKADASNFGVPAETPSEQTVNNVPTPVASEVPVVEEAPSVEPVTPEAPAVPVAEVVVVVEEVTVEPAAPDVWAVEDTPAASVAEVVVEEVTVEPAAPDVPAVEETPAAPVPEVVQESPEAPTNDAVEQKPHVETHVTTAIVTEEVTPIVLAPAVEKAAEVVEESPAVPEPEVVVKAIPSEPVSENQPSAPNAAVKSPLATPPPAAPPTTSTFTTPVPGTTVFHPSTTKETAPSSSSTVSSSQNSHKGVPDKAEEASAALKDKIPETKKKEKRRSHFLHRIRNAFKPEQERGISILVSAVMCLLAASLLAGKFEWRSMLEVRGRAG